MNNYEFDIFISYRRLGTASNWIAKHLIPVLTDALGLELGRNPSIYFDTKLEASDTWPIELGANLARSRTMLCLWSRTYVESVWCARELSVMKTRENRLGLRTPNSPNGTIAISVIHDGETIPHELSIIQKFEMMRYYNPMMREDSPLREEFFTALQATSSTLASMIQHAPEFQPDWTSEVAQEMFDTFHRQIPAAQTHPPRYTT